ncbi:hypothetical protein L207DRAFT_537742 [Hyaloscypha variabilis F]|uniref:GPI anchored protein n=1 Tax=Hyaloscypha variabilis (strain UAMH 11265 / GT02V1 / F) TaxID=1149755 RepID=A0A2J6QW75_HYAVF|nr:hypothetical protein L207DRAFT_537742 [Hyaloscypha variabilis F]
MLWGIVLSFIATGVVADSAVSLFNPNPGVSLSAYEAGVTKGLTTYLLGCGNAASATGACDFTAPITLVEGTATYHVVITTPLPDGYTQTLTVDCPSGTAAGCSVTALNKAHVTTTVALNASYFEAGVVAFPTVASAGGLLYNGVPLPTASAYPTTTYASNTTAPTTYTYAPTATGGGSYSNSTITKGSSSKSPASTSTPAVATKSGAVSQYLGAQVVFALLVGACVVLLGW